MIEFIDKTEASNGTKINRASMMAIQGFIGNKTIFNEDGTVTQTNANGEILTTTFNDDGTITERFVGDKIITKTTTINEESIEVEVTEELS